MGEEPWQGARFPGETAIQTSGRDPVYNGDVSLILATPLNEAICTTMTAPESIESRRSVKPFNPAYQNRTDA
jgi:hypothetical protein